MKRVLLVDDDPLILRMYNSALLRRGFQVDIAADGLSAIKFLREAPPNVVVLDLMMPTLSGVEVLKFIRGQPSLVNLPVVVLSNANMDAMAREVARIGIQRALLKARCNPEILGSTLDEVLEGIPARTDVSELLVVPPENSKGPEEALAALPSPASAAPPPPPISVPPPVELKPVVIDSATKVREAFLAAAGANCAALRKLFQAFSNARTPAERGLRLQDLNRKVQFIAATAAMTKCPAVAQLAGAYEAMLLAALDAIERIGPSLMLTSMRAIDFLEGLFQHTGSPQPRSSFKAQILVVDDDAASNRLILAACRQAKLQPQAVEDSITAWQWVNQKPYDLVFIDMVMPGLAGPDFCQRLRTLPAYQSTSVIYIVNQSEFEQTAPAVLNAGQDLIAKPLFPTELVLKALMHLLHRQAVNG